MAVCEKKPYRTKTAAMLSLRAQQRRGAGRPNGRVPTGAYLCSVCGLWHLTSKSGTQTAPWERRATCDE